MAVLLRLNMGRGYYSFAEFIKGVVTAASDASKERRFAGGGYWTRGIRNTYRFFRFGGRAPVYPVVNSTTEDRNDVVCSRKIDRSGRFGVSSRGFF